jgi:hypothetical protein
MTTSSLGTLSTDMVFTIDAVNELMEFVVHDPQSARLGLRGAISVVMGRRLGGPPSEEIVSLMTQVFWDAWEDRLGVYERRPPRHPR